jgi:hypothetical protein
LWLAETSQQPISQTTWLKITPHCNHFNHCNHCNHCTVRCIGLCHYYQGEHNNSEKTKD